MILINALAETVLRVVVRVTRIGFDLWEHSRGYTPEAAEKDDEQRRSHRYSQVRSVKSDYCVGGSFIYVICLLSQRIDTFRLINTIARVISSLSLSLNRGHFSTFVFGSYVLQGDRFRTQIRCYSWLNKAKHLRVSINQKAENKDNVSFSETRDIEQGSEH